MYKKMFFLSGLPRSGSTLLLSILSQNPKIYSEGTSALCKLMLDAKYSCEVNCLEQIVANKKYNFKNDLLSSIPQIYYKNTKSDYIFDKSRIWTHPENFNLIQEYIDPNPKIIILVRDVLEIVKSFKRIGFIPLKKTENNIFESNSEPLMNSLFGVLYGIDNLYKYIHVVNYENLVLNTEKEIIKIYDFLEIKRFNHNLKNIQQTFFEDDSVYGINNLHKIQNKIQKINYNINLDKITEEKCLALNNFLFEKLNQVS